MKTNNTGHIYQTILDGRPVWFARTEWWVKVGTTGRSPRSRKTILYTVADVKRWGKRNGVNIDKAINTEAP